MSYYELNKRKTRINDLSAQCSALHRALVNLRELFEQEATAATDEVRRDALRFAANAVDEQIHEATNR